MGNFVNGNIITLPIGEYINTAKAKAEIAALLAVGPREEDGRLHLSDLCVAGSLNPWAKYKPVRSSATANTATTYKADGWCGFNVSNAIVSERGDVSGISSKMTLDGMNGWEYVKPRGDVVSPIEYSRLFDFNGYLHTAVPFVQKLTLPGSWALQSGEPFQAGCIYFEKGDSYNLTQHDLPIKDYYFGLALISGTKVYRMTNTAPISEAGFTLSFDTTRLTTGLYDAFAFISTRILTITDSDVIPATIYTVPRTLMNSIRIVQSQVNITARGQYNLEKTQMSYTVQVTNGSGSSVTFENNYVRLRYADKSWNDVLVAGEKEDIIATFTLAAGASKTITGTMTGFPTDIVNGSQLMVSLGTGTHRVAVGLRSPASPTSL